MCSCNTCKALHLLINSPFFAFALVFFTISLFSPVSSVNCQTEKNDTAENDDSVTAVPSLEAESLTSWRAGRKNLKRTGQGLHSNYRAAVGLSVKCGQLWQNQIDSWNKNMLLLTFRDAVPL